MEELNGTGIFLRPPGPVFEEVIPLGTPSFPVVHDLGSSDAFAFHAGNLVRIEDNPTILVRLSKGSNLVQIHVLPLDHPTHRGNISAPRLREEVEPIDNFPIGAIEGDDILSLIDSCA